MEDVELEHLARTKLVAVMINPATSVRLPEEVFIELVSLMQATYLHYDDPLSLLSMSLPGADDGTLHAEASCRVLCRAAATQLSFGRSAFVVCPLQPNVSKAHLNGLLEVADSYGVPLTVIQLQGEPQLPFSSQVPVAMNGIPHLIFSLEGLGFDRKDHGEGNDHLVGKHRELTQVQLFVVCTFWGFIKSFDSKPKINRASISDSLQFRHFGHRHPLLMNPGVDVNAPAMDTSCSVCAAKISCPDYYYGCVSCCYFLHKTCAELPQNIVSLAHSHALRLVILSKEKEGSDLFNYSRKNPNMLIMCLICHGFAEEGPLRPFYGCLHCPDLFVHYECISSQRHIIDHRLHPHPLELQTMQFPLLGPYIICHACGCVGNKIWYTCKECRFDYHKECLADFLPPSVRHERHKEHALTLSVPPKDETDEYYCEVCAKRRHPDYWIYYCKRCEYEAHPHCVIKGIPPYPYDGGKDRRLEDSGHDQADFKDEMRQMLRELREKNKDISKHWYDYI